MGIDSLEQVLQRYSYCSYFIIGAIVGIVTVFVREVIGSLLPADTPVYYTLSVVLAYSGGIFASYYGHRTVTFRHRRPTVSTLNSLGRFTLIAIFGLITTTLLAVLLRYLLPLDGVLGEFKPAVAFAVAVILTSILTYGLNAIFTFGNKISDIAHDKTLRQERSKY